MKKQGKYNTLNAKQVHILKLTYKFRFITAPLMASYKNLKSRHSMYMTLERLAQQEYLGKRVSNNSDFQNKGIRYYLTPKGLRFLKKEHGFSSSTMFATYKNSSVSESFIDQYTSALQIYLAIRESYPDTFHIFTKTELLDYDNFPKQLPELYLNRIKLLEHTNEYVVYILPPTQFFIIKKLFNTLLEHFDLGDWETEYPVTLIVCPDSRMEERLQKHIANVLDNAGVDDMAICTTTLKALLNSSEQNKAVWSSVNEPEKLISLV